MSKAQQANAFLIKNGMHYSLIDMHSHVQLFLDEMRKGLAGQESSLLMLPTYIETGLPVPANEKALVIDAGGTNFRSAVVSFTEDRQPVIEFFKKIRMPGADSEVSKKIFFDTMAAEIEPIAGQSRKIGFCFSYAVESNAEKDGKLLIFSKQIKAPEVIGSYVGKSLLEALKARGQKSSYNIAVLNDTVTTLLTGMTAIQNSSYEGYLGFILGTGTNTAYDEANENIAKAPNLAIGRRQVINIESGSFDKQKRGVFDELVDRQTRDHGKYTFEKMISGAYFGMLCRTVLNGACSENVFSKSYCEALQPFLANLTTKDIGDFLENPFSAMHPLGSLTANADKDDIEAAYIVCDNMAERAAKLTAVNLCAALLKSGHGKSPLHPACITIDGTTFYTTKLLPERVKSYMFAYLQGDNRRYFEFAKVDDAPLLGAAIAALTNFS